MPRLIPIVALTLCISSCNKKCVSDIQVCKQDPSEAGYCSAYFERWFYDTFENKCKEIGYSGCTESGFETKSECEACSCN